MKYSTYLSCLGLFSCLGVTTSFAQLSDGLIGYWEFEQDLTNSAASAAGTGIHDGTLVLSDGTSIDPSTGQPYLAFYTTGPDAAFGDALDVSFGGEGVRINHSNSGEAGYVDTFDAALDSESGMTVSLWARGFPANWSPWVAKNGEAAGFQVRRRSGSQLAAYTLRGTLGADDPVGGIEVDTGAEVWNHYVGTWDSATGERKLYINGVEDVASSLTGDLTDAAVVDPPGPGPFNASDFWLTIGMRHTDADPDTFGAFFTGLLDDVAIWDRPLTSAEVVLLSGNPLSVAMNLVDSDSDGLSDDDENLIYNTNPNSADSDGDGAGDYDEVQQGGDPTQDDDIDNDGLFTSERQNKNCHIVSDHRFGSFKEKPVVRQKAIFRHEIVNGRPHIP